MNLKKVYSIGLMSGTSLDGVDIVYVSFDNRNGYSFDIIYSEQFRIQILGSNN